MSLVRVSAAIVSLSILASCAAPQSVPARDIHALETAERICNIGSLTQEYDRMRSDARAISTPSHWTANVLLAPWPGNYIDRHVSAHASENRDINRGRPFGQPTPTIDLVRTFEVDLDASYRASTSSCQAYAACMYQNRYNEHLCSASRMDWQRAQTRFQGLSLQLANARISMAQICPDCPPYIIVPQRRRGVYGDRHHDPYYAPYRRRQDCQDYIGGVFTTSSCRRY